MAKSKKNDEHPEPTLSVRVGAALGERYEWRHDRWHRISAKSNQLPVPAYEINLHLAMDALERYRERYKELTGNQLNYQIFGAADVTVALTHVVDTGMVSGTAKTLSCAVCLAIVNVNDSLASQGVPAKLINSWEEAVASAKAALFEIRQRFPRATVEMEGDVLYLLKHKPTKEDNQVSNMGDKIIAGRSVR